MLRRSEDVFLDKLDGAVCSIIKAALRELDVGNSKQAWEMLKPLADHNNEAAIYYLSCFGIPGEQIQDFEKRRIEQLSQSAKYGYAPAIHELAIHYDTGELVPREVEMAAQLFRQAAEKDHPHAQWIYGLDLLYGRSGIKKDVDLGLAYIKKSAAAKFEGALETMSEFYGKGVFGFPVDSEKSTYYKNQICGEDVLSY